MEIAALRVFVEVMRRRSFTAVAAALDVAPSSVSRTIAGLEAELGVRLFQRTTRTLSPTDAALAYFDRVEPMLVELENAASLAGESGESPRGVVRLTSAGAFAQLNVVPLLPELAQRYPELRFELVLTDTFLDLIAERIDLAIRLGRLTESSLIAQRLCDITYVVCASPEYLRRRGRPKTPRDLERHDCLRYPVPGFGARWRFRKGPQEAFEVPISGSIVANDGVALVQSAVAGMGIVMLPRWHLADELRRGTLIELFADYQASASEFDIAAWMIYSSRSYLPRRVRVVADFLKEKFREGAPAEVGLAERRTKKP